jgi:hypothetical protein
VQKSRPARWPIRRPDIVTVATATTPPSSLAATIGVGATTAGRGRCDRRTESPDGSPTEFGLRGTAVYRWSDLIGAPSPRRDDI